MIVIAIIGLLIGVGSVA
ncbi:MAG: hypothetical protein IPO41_13760 [Acidobacteria bacterium]|nr:hypothetical protein [Acidobacteriota bacterium]